LHVDAVQAVGRIPCSMANLNADLLTVSAHKIGGPHGAGALVKRDASIHLDPLIKGGGQERRMRAGTENVAAIAGFGAAAAAAGAERDAAGVRMAALRERLEAGLKAGPHPIVIFGAASPRLPNTTLFAMPGIRAETAIIACDLEGFAVSSGAACSSGKVQPSHVLAAMGVEPALAAGAIRVSLGPATSEIDVERFYGAWIKLSGALLNRTKTVAA
jgi:cysteine desulfurase